MPLLKRKAKGFETNFEKQLPSPEALAEGPQFPVSDDEVLFLSILEQATQDGSFNDREDRLRAIRLLAGTVGRTVGIHFDHAYLNLAVDPSWVRNTLESGDVPTVITQMDRIQSVQDQAQHLATYVLATITD
jgi:hypothetical protein